MILTPTRPVPRALPMRAAITAIVLLMATVGQVPATFAQEDPGTCTDPADTSCMPSGDTSDQDQDGYTVEQGDCDDNDAAINPGATDTPGDGIDQDCNGADAPPPDCNDQDPSTSDFWTEADGCQNVPIDQDQDGFTVEQGDCNDTDPLINPEAEDPAGDGIDQNCSGADTSPSYGQPCDGPDEDLLENGVFDQHGTSCLGDAPVDLPPDVFGVTPSTFEQGSTNSVTETFRFHEAAIAVGAPRTLSPLVHCPIQSTLITGDSEPDAILDIHVNGVFRHTASADGTGGWDTPAGDGTAIGALASGDVVTAIARAPGKVEGPPSDPCFLEPHTGQPEDAALPLAILFEAPMQGVAPGESITIQGTIENGGGEPMTVQDLVLGLAAGWRASVFTFNGILVDCAADCDTNAPSFFLGQALAANTARDLSFVVHAPPGTATGLHPLHASAQTTSTITGDRVEIMGAEFDEGAAVGVSGLGVTARNVELHGPGSLAATLIVAPDAPAGPRDVTVTNPDGKIGTCAGCFMVAAGPDGGGGTEGGGTEGGDPMAANTLHVGSAVVVPGGAAVVPLDLFNVTDLGTATVIIGFDPAVVQALEVINGEVPSSALEANLDNQAGSVRLVVVTGDVPGASGDFLLASLRLEAVGAVGDASILSVTVEQLADTAGEAITPELLDGSFQVGLPGDSSGDGEVTGVDAMFIMQYVAGNRPGEDLHLGLLDLDGDGQVTGVDAMFIMQFVTGNREDLGGGVVA